LVARLVSGLAAVAVLVLYLRVIRPWQLRWGATDDEVRRTLPGDDVALHPSFNATRAVTALARPDEIWPWLLQLGFRRAGWYSYDWIDNLGAPSAERIIPELQHVAVGDFVPLGSGAESGFWVKAFEPNQWLLWADKQGTVTWLWVLHPLDESRTCLATRVRVRYNWCSPWMLFHLVFDLGDIVMMRKCMLGIKQRAGLLARQRRQQPEAGSTNHASPSRVAPPIPAGLIAPCHEVAAAQPSAAAPAQSPPDRATRTPRAA